MPFLKIISNLKILLIAFCILFVIFWSLFKDKRAQYKCTLELPVKESALLRFVPDPDYYLKSLKKGTNGWLAKDRIILEKLSHDKNGCVKSLEEEAGNLMKIINERARKQMAIETLLLGGEIEKTDKEAQDLKAALAILNKEKERFQLQWRVALKERDALVDKISRLQAQKEQLLLTYTVEHPEVIRLQDEIVLLEDKVKKMFNPEIEMANFSKQDELVSKNNQYELLQKRSESLSVMKTDLQATAEAIPVMPAQPTSVVLYQKPSSKIISVLGLSTLLSLLIFAVFLFLDPKIYRIGDLKNFSVLTSLPKIKKKIFRMPFYQENIEAENSLKKIAFSLKEGKVIFVTSFREKEGKTTLAFNLGAFLAKNAKKVAIVDLNFKNPSLQLSLRHKENRFINDITELEKLNSNLFNFSNLVFDDPGCEGFIQKSGLDRVSLLFARRQEQVDLGYFKKIAEKLKEYYDYVICDSPVFSDDLLRLVRKEDELIFVLRRGYTRTDYVEKLGERLALDKVSHKGIIFNLCI